MKTIVMEMKIVIIKIARETSARIVIGYEGMEIEV